MEAIHSLGRWVPTSVVVQFNLVTNFNLVISGGRSTWLSLRSAMTCIPQGCDEPSLVMQTTQACQCVLQPIGRNEHFQRVMRRLRGDHIDSPSLLTVAL
jgi:hypothetical protein